METSQPTVSNRIREEEEWAGRVVETYLGCPVHKNDDGSRDSMYDLRVGTPDDPEIAIECVQNTCPDSVRVWKKGAALGSRKFDTKGTWVVELLKSCRVQRLRRKLGPVLESLHAAGCFHLDTEGAISVVAKELAELGVTDVLCYEPDGDGDVYFSMARPGGMIDSAGADLADWISRFLASEKCADVRHKLNISGAAERHVCIVLTLNSDMTGPLLYHVVAGNCPVRSLAAPAEVTGVWLLLPSAGKGLFWDLTGWRAVDASID
jgi:hypothetical protein